VALVGRGQTNPEIAKAVDALIELAPAPKTMPATNEMDIADSPAEPQNPQAIYLHSGLLWDFAALQEIGKQTLSRIKLNKLISLITFLLILPPAAGAFYTFGIPFLPAWGALAGQGLALILVTINSLR